MGLRRFGNGYAGVLGSGNGDAVPVELAGPRRQRG